MKKTQYIAVAAALLFSSTAWAAPYTIANSFIAGTPAIAGQVNANFTAAKTAIDDNDTRITANAAAAATNATNITANAASAATNATNITANAASAATNATNITNNTTNITALQALHQTALATVVNVPVVGTAIANGTALMNAVAGITGSSPTNQFTLKLERGTYDLGIQTLVLPDGVNIEGVAPGLTVVTSAIAPPRFPAFAVTVKALGSSTISTLTLQGTAPSINLDVSAVLSANSGTVLINKAQIEGIVAQLVIPIVIEGLAPVTVIVDNSQLTTQHVRQVFTVNGAQAASLYVYSSEFGPTYGLPVVPTKRCFLSHYSNGTAVPAACL